MPEMTDPQRVAFAARVAEARAHGAEVSDNLGRFNDWRINWREEVRPGRGNDLDALWCDSDYLVQITLDVYGSGPMSVASVAWIHSDSDEECSCERCTAEEENPDG